jgi:hypothetical protein
MKETVHFAIVLVSLFAAAFAVFAGTETAGALDGKSFTVTMTEQGGEEQPDTLIFADGTFDSVACREYGFGAAPYQAEKKGDAWTFSAETRSEEEGVARWKGTVTGETVEGTMEWLKPGQDAIRYEFSGSLES